jgi:hypothetical protein
MRHPWPKDVKRRHAIQELKELAFARLERGYRAAGLVKRGADDLSLRCIDGKNE